MKHRKCKWTLDELRDAVKKSTSIRQVLSKLGLIEAGGNYDQIKKWIAEIHADTSHFVGRGWRKGKKYDYKPKVPLEEVMVLGSDYQSFKLKRRLFLGNIKEKKCEECGWAKYSKDGRLPLELDHINGNKRDNRLENLRILCPNCHSLKPTHRGRNKRVG